MSTSAFGVEHGEVSKGAGDVARKLGVARTWKAAPHLGQGGKEGAGTWALKPAKLRDKPGSKPSRLTQQISGGGLTGKGIAATGAATGAAAGATGLAIERKKKGNP